MADSDTPALRELIAETLAAKWAHDSGVLTSGTAVQVWRPYADAVLGLFDVGRESYGDAPTRVVLTLAPAAPEVGHA